MGDLDFRWSRSRALVGGAALACVLVCVAGRARGADGTLTLVLAGRADRVVAAGRGVGVLRAGAVSLLDGDGHVVARCAGASTTAGRAARPDHTALTSEEVLNEAGFSDEDVSPEAEELLDDEGTGASSRRRSVSTSAGAPRANDIAGAPDAVWIGTTEGVWRLDGGGAGCARAGLGGHAIDLVAATGTTIVALAGATVWRRDDAGQTFAVAAVLTSRPHALVVAPDGTAFVADEDGVVELAEGMPARRVLTTPTDALATCGSDVFALADADVVSLSIDGDAVALGHRPPAPALACVGPERPRLLAAGVGVWSSAAAGAPWVEDLVGLGRSFASVAGAAGRVWLAADDGLFATGLDGPAAVPTIPAPRRHPDAPPTSPPSWAAFLPRVALAGGGWTESNGVTGWRLWLLMTFSLDRFAVRRATRKLEDFR